MRTKTPVIRQISWGAIVPTFVALLASVYVASLLTPSRYGGLIWGVGVCAMYAFGIRHILLREHNAGMRLVKKQRFEEAIPFFRRGLEFLDRHSWIDRFRSVVLMSASAMSYREMALANIAFCYGQTGNGGQARAHYEECLRRFPDSGLAATALRFMDSAAAKPEG